ncbi:MAG TPA: hypothetical protein VM492_16380, partial [Sumerlaeia bacterium]|nr:hypothetical protein [Sumerlaeia bacterium]
EKDRQTLKLCCPAAAFGLECENREACADGVREAAPPPVRDGAFGRVAGAPLQTDRRLFFPAYRHSCTFRNGYPPEPQTPQPPNRGWVNMHPSSFRTIPEQGQSQNAIDTGPAQQYEFQGPASAPG